MGSFRKIKAKTLFNELVRAQLMKEAPYKIRP